MGAKINVVNYLRIQIEVFKNLINSIDNYQKTFFYLNIC